MPYTNCYLGENGCNKEPKKCATCGFDVDEAERRKNLPLTLCPDGLRSKIITKEKK